MTVSNTDNYRRFIMHLRQYLTAFSSISVNFFPPNKPFSVDCRSGKNRNKDHQIMTISLTILEQDNRERELFIYLSLF